MALQVIYLLISLINSRAWAAFKKLDDATKVAALSLLFRGTAAIGNETVDVATQKNSFENFKKAFTPRFFPYEEFKSLQIGKIW